MTAEDAYTTPATVGLVNGKQEIVNGTYVPAKDAVYSMNSVALFG